MKTKLYTPFIFCILFFLQILEGSESTEELLDFIREEKIFEKGKGSFRYVMKFFAEEMDNKIEQLVQKGHPMPSTTKFEKSASWRKYSLQLDNNREMVVNCEQLTEYLLEHLNLTNRFEEKIALIGLKKLIIFYHDDRYKEKEVPHEFYEKIQMDRYKEALKGKHFSIHRTAIIKYGENTYIMTREVLGDVPSNANKVYQKFWLKKINRDYMQTPYGIWDVHGLWNKEKKYASSKSDEHFRINVDLGWYYNLYLPPNEDWYVLKGFINQYDPLLISQFGKVLTVDYMSKILDTTLLQEFKTWEAGRIENVRTENLLKILEHLIPILNASKDGIILNNMKIDAMTEDNFDQETITLQWNLLRVKIELELIIEEKFEKLKKINPNSANALLEKYSWLKDFLIAPELVTSQNTENVQPPWNILNTYDENYKPEYSDFETGTNSGGILSPLKTSEEEIVQKLRTNQLLDMLEDDIKILNQTTDVINAKEKKMKELKGHNFDDEESINKSLSETMISMISIELENYLVAKMQHEFNIEEKFDELKEFDPDSANALLQKYQKLTFLTPPNMVTYGYLETQNEISENWDQSIDKIEAFIPGLLSKKVNISNKIEDDYSVNAEALSFNPGVYGLTKKENANKIENEDEEFLKKYENIDFDGFMKKRLQENAKRWNNDSKQNNDSNQYWKNMEKWVRDDRANLKTLYEKLHYECEQLVYSFSNCEEDKMTLNDENGNYLKDDDDDSKFNEKMLEAAKQRKNNFDIENLFRLLMKVNKHRAWELTEEFDWLCKYTI